MLTAYHVVTDRPMRVGQVIRFDETHHSGVWQRVMDKMPLVQDILTHPERYPDPLEHHTDVIRVFCQGNRINEFLAIFVGRQ